VVGSLEVWAAWEVWEVWEASKVWEGDEKKKYGFFIYDTLAHILHMVLFYGFSIVKPPPPY